MPSDAADGRRVEQISAVMYTPDHEIRLFVEFHIQVELRGGHCHVGLTDRPSSRKNRVRRLQHEHGLKQGMLPRFAPWLDVAHETVERHVDGAQ